MLIIAPIRVCYLVWPLEVAKWQNFDHLNINIMHGPKKNLWTNEHADLHIINPDGLPWLLSQLKGKRKTNWPFQMMVNDESTLFKNHSSTRFKNIKKIIPHMQRRYILTGTPIPNGYEQLFSQMQIVDEGWTLGNKIGEYHRRYFDSETQYFGQAKFEKYTLMDNGEKRINKKIAPFVVRMSTEDHLNLPPLINNKIYVELPKKVEKQYSTLKKEMFLEIDGKDVYPPTAASVCQKLHQMANGNLYENWDELELGKVPPSHKRPYFKLHTKKLDALEELLHELNGKPLFVAYWYYHDLESIKGRFKNAVVLNSKTSEREAVIIEKRWNAGKIDLLIAQPASVAHGLNFQYAGGDICWYSLIYDYEIFEQFIKRVHRQGVKDAVRNHFLMAKGTIDEVIFNKLQDKKDNQDEFFSLLSLYQKLIKKGEML